MKKLLTLTALLFLAAGLAGATDQVDIQVGNLILDTLRIDIPSTLDIYIENDNVLGGMSLGFQIWSPDGATWAWDNVGGLGLVTGCVTPVVTSRLGSGSVFDMTSLLVTEQNIDGMGRDTIMCGGVAMMVGLPPGPLEHMYSYHFTPGSPAGGDPMEVVTMCFDSCFVPPSGAFVFVDLSGNAYPPGVLWTFGSKCYPVNGARCCCPEWDASNPTSMTVNHCDVGQVVLQAADMEANDIQFGPATVIGGSGTAVVTKNNSQSCTLTYTPSPSDVGQTITIEVGIADAYNSDGCVPWTIAVNVTNNPPTITCGRIYNPVCSGNTFTKSDIVGMDIDTCDDLTYALISVAPPSIGTVTLDAATGELIFSSDNMDMGIYTITVGVTDGYEVAECSFEAEVFGCEWYEVKIAKLHDVLQGHYVDVELSQTKGSDAMGGFDFLIGYDASALAFTEATLSDHLVSCGWEHFTYRYDWNGNCGAACPTGLVRLIGLAETVNGAYHPDYACISDYTAGPIATMTFYVSNDRTYECMYLPIQFYWMDCNDNSISVPSGDTLAVNNRIYTFEGEEIQDFNYGLPGYYGIPDDPCMEGDKVEPIRYVDFINGGIDVVCADSIDARGDINVNGVSYEIADAVMLTNYFINGLSQFSFHVESSIAASDVNNDGIVLSVADLVYLIRVIVGDANPYPKPIPESPVTIVNQGGIVTYDSPVDLGAALLIFDVGQNHETPQLGAGASGMDMKFAYSGDELRVLIYNIGDNKISAGENTLLNIPGRAELTSAEVASFDGFGLETFVRSLPREFSVANYPNPFNPATTISMALPEACDWSVTIFNVAGQIVRQFAGESDAGKVDVVWNGTDSNGRAVASGIYFYKAQAGEYSATRKMVLMK